MRYNEFKSKPQLDEIAPLIPLLMYGGSAALTAWEANNIYKDYKAGKITKDQMLARAGIAAGSAVAGGLAGKLVGKAAGAIGSGLGKLFKGKKAKDAAATAGAEVVGKTKDGADVVRSKKGNLTKAGADGKATTQIVDPKDMKKAPKPAKGATATGAAVGATAKKAPLKKSTSAGAAAGATAKKAPLKKSTAAGTLAGTAAGVAGSQLAGKLADFRKQQDAKRAQQTQTGVLYKGKASGPKSMVDIK